MSTNRRTFIKSAFVLLACAIDLKNSQFIRAAEEAAKDLPRPNPSQFESGDFVWPKKPGAYVPYNAGTQKTTAADRAQWIKDRDEFIRKEKAKPKLDPVSQETIRRLQSMDFREFIAIYEGDQTPGVPGVYSGGNVYVGHVGIIEIDSEKRPWVIEALYNRGVVKHPYSEWITQRADEVIWLGRLKQVERSDRARVAVEATRHVGKPYDFWNFDLNDDSAFYCSKLAWLSIFRSLHFPVDGKGQANRSFWFSPKQLLYLPTIDRLHDPGPYAHGN